jgi:NADPH-dependent 7-cyano-7-deazaguanine reductase QueF
MTEWSDPTILKSIPNTCFYHKHTIITSELTFHGYPEQPDYATLTIVVTPNKKAIELKSVKQYLFQFRLTHISYERLLNTIYNDFEAVYQPAKLYIKMETQPRGGLKSIVEKGFY